MRHFMFIKAVYWIVNVKVNDDKLLAVYNLAKIAAKNSTLAQFTFAGIDWSVKHYGDSIWVSLITKEIMYTIYDCKGDKKPIIKIDIIK